MIERQPASVAFRLEEVPDCPVCGRPGVLHHERVIDRLCRVPGEWNYRHCVKCGSLWLSPRPIDADLGLCYPDGYFTHSARSPGRAPRPGGVRAAKERLRRAVLAASFGYGHLSHAPPIGRATARLLAVLPPVRWEATHHLGACLVPYHPGGRLLDVGCGNGQYLSQMREYGWEVAGIEIDAAAARVARERHGLEVHNGTVENAPFPPASFRVVTCQQVLEHVAHPLLLLRAMARFLEPGGRLVVVTPNAGSLGHQVFGRDCFSLDAPRHLVIHTPASIRRLLDQIPELRLVRLRTHARIARKIYLQWRSVRQSSSFRGEGVRVSTADRLGALAFSYAETVGVVTLPLGEEIELVAERRA
jgi:2-polyprenyl-3-methyl-5-hydroxy-6-metoxy-1,4-benzoquinol methylase